jgi:hypothetical protein
MLITYAKLFESNRRGLVERFRSIQVAVGGLDVGQR